MNVIQYQQVSWNRGTPSHHPFLDDIFHYKATILGGPPFMEPPWLVVGFYHPILTYINYRYLIDKPLYIPQISPWNHPYRHVWCFKFQWQTARQIFCPQDQWSPHSTGSSPQSWRLPAAAARFGMCYWYLVHIQQAIEHDHRNSWFTKKKTKGQKPPQAR